MTEQVEKKAPFGLVMGILLFIIIGIIAYDTVSFYEHRHLHPDTTYLDWRTRYIK